MMLHEVSKAIEANYAKGNAEAICLAAEAARWTVLVQAIHNGDVSIPSLLNFGTEFYSESFSSELLAALDYEENFETFADQIDQWEIRHTPEYKQFLALKEKYADD